MQQRRLPLYLPTNGGCSHPLSQLSLAPPPLHIRSRCCSGACSGSSAQEEDGLHTQTSKWRVLSRTTSVPQKPQAGNTSLATLKQQNREKEGETAIQQPLEVLVHKNDTQRGLHMGLLTPSASTKKRLQPHLCCLGVPKVGRIEMTTRATWI